MIRPVYELIPKASFQLDLKICGTTGLSFLSNLPNTLVLTQHATWFPWNPKCISCSWHTLFTVSKTIPLYLGSFMQEALFIFFFLSVYLVLCLKGWRSVTRVPIH